MELDEKQRHGQVAVSARSTPGQAELEIEFTGILNDQLLGFYRSTFTDVDGVEQAIATTQFEATDARRAFPCWDEPDFKAVFSITLVIPEDLFAVSNGPEIGRRAGRGRQGRGPFRRHHGHVHLSGRVRGRPLEATEPVDVDGVPVRIVAPRGKLGPPQFALDCAVFVFRYLARLLRDSLSGPQDRSCRHSRFRLRGDGEPRMHHLSGDGSCWSTPTRPASLN